jgi:Leucine-rich repeat (LRR) protein
MVSEQSSQGELPPAIVPPGALCEDWIPIPSPEVSVGDVLCERLTWFGSTGRPPSFRREGMRIFASQDGSAFRLAGVVVPTVHDLDLVRTELARAEQPIALWVDAELAADVAQMDGVARVEVLGIFPHRGWDHPLDFLHVFQNVRALDLTSAHLVDLRLVSPLRQLRALSLEYAYCGDLAPLGDLPELRILNLSCGPGVDMSSVPLMPELRALTLPATTTADHLRTLPERLPKLERLNGWDCSLLTDLELLAPFTQLTSLDSSSDGFHDLAPLTCHAGLRHLVLHVKDEPKSIAPLQKLTSLRSLELNDCQNVSDFSPLSDLRELEHVVLTRGFAQEHVKHLEHLGPTLRYLHLHSDRVHDLGTLEKFPNLESAHLYCHSIESFRCLRPLERLKALYAYLGSQATDYTHISELSSLESLELHAHEQHTDIRWIAPLQSLKSLELSGSELSDLSPLASLKRLSSLKLSRSDNVTDHSVLSQMPQLISVHLDYCPIEEAWQAPPDSALLQLNLDNCPLTDIRGLAGHKRLRALNLSSAEQLEDISPLGQLEQLSWLTLAFCTKVSDISALRHASWLVSLDLTQCDRLTDLSSLWPLSQVRELNLSYIENGLVDISPLRGMWQLDTLSLENCLDLEDLTPLVGLEQLRFLTLDGVMADDASPLRKLSNLECLSWQFSWIDDFSFLLKLEKLKYLDMTGGQNALPPKLHEALTKRGVRIESDEESDE